MSSLAQGQGRQSLLRAYWERHPVLYEVFQVIGEGQWITHLFEWIFLMISRIAAYGMTLAVGFLIYYAIETNKSLSNIPTGAHAILVDQLASFSSMIINVTPELVFPGVVVLCIRGFIARRWLDGWLYLFTCLVFGLLTMILLHAFMSSGINEDFMSAMLFWRAGAAIFYTVTVAVCGSHGGLDLRTLLNELDTLREEIANRDQHVDRLQRQLDTANLRITALSKEVQGKEQEVSLLKDQVNNRQSLFINGQSAIGDLELQLQQVTSQLQQVTREKQLLTSQIEQLTSQVNGSEDQTSDLFTRLQIERKQVSDLTGQLQEMTLEKQQMTSQMNRSQQQVKDLEKQVKDLTSQTALLTSKLEDMTSTTGHMKAVKSKRSQNEEVVSKSTQGTVLQFDEGRRRRDPLEVKAWCDAHSDLTQAEQAEQLGISDAANLRRILRRARELEGTSLDDQQIANDL